MDQERDKFSKLNQTSNPNMPRDTVETIKQIQQKKGLQISIIASSGSPAFPLPQQASATKQNVQTTEKVCKVVPRPQSTAENKSQVLQTRLTSTPVSTTRLTPQTTFHDSKISTTQGGRSGQGTVTETKGFNPGWNNSNSSENKPQGNASRTIQATTASKVSNITRLGQILVSDNKTPTSRNSQVLPETKNQGRTTPGQRAAQGHQIIANKLQNSQDGSNINPTSPPESKVFTNQARTSFVVSHDGKTTTGQRIVSQKVTEVKVSNQTTTNKQIEIKTTPVNRVIPNMKALPDATPGKRQNFVKVDGKGNIGAVVESKLSNSARLVTDGNTQRTNQAKTSSTPVRLHPNVSAADAATPVHTKIIQNIPSQVENKILLQGDISSDSSIGGSITPARSMAGKRASSVCSPAKKKCVKRTPTSDNSNLTPGDRNENGEQIFNTLKNRTPGLTITPVVPSTAIVATPTSNSSCVSKISGELMDKDIPRLQCPSCNNYTINSKWCHVCKCDLTSIVQSSQHSTEIAGSSLIVKNVNVMVSKQIIFGPSDALGQGQSIQFGQTVQREKIYIKASPVIQASRSKSRGRGRRRYVEPVCLTLSSDDEDEHMQEHFNPFSEENLSNQSQMFPPESEGSKSDPEDENAESDDAFPGVTDIHPQQLPPQQQLPQQQPDDRNMYDEDEEEDKEMDELDMDEDGMDEEGEEELEESEMDEEEEDEEVPPEDEEDEEPVMSKVPMDNVTSVDDPLRCRSVRIGSFKVHPKPNNSCLGVHMRMDGISFPAPMVTDSNKIINIVLKPSDITNMLFHFGRCLPIMFLFTTSSFAENVRKTLNMQSGEFVYFDPASNDEKQKKITFLIDSITEEQRTFLRHNFPVDNISELDQKTANEILVKSTPNQNYPRCDKMQAFPLPTDQLSVTAIQPVAVKVHHPPQPVTKLFTYPPPPQTGGIAITNEDLACLNEGEFLNDAIIDFYLKYIYYEKLSEYHREKTHIFSSYFYPRLTHKPGSRPGEEGQKSVQIRRHSQVKTWTRNIDIFSKDFIIIPVNQNVHWFLAIICYPGLVPDAPDPPPKPEPKNGKSSDNVTSTDDQEESKTTKEPNSTSEGANQNIDENSTASNNSMCESEEPDSEEPVPEAPDSSTHPDKIRRRKEAPCICIFDSLNGPNRWRISSILREYLEIEWKLRKGTRKVFDKNTIPGYIMQCPQQTNYSDCGIYVLQYVESFFENPLPYFDSPIADLTHWFPKEKVAKKRQELKDLILNLQKKSAQSVANFRKANPSENIPSSPSKTLQTDNR